ncbi:kinase-like domain-containing protein [Nemania diffusa]|nr:kinase-like domain-containing protein [Nemania diffusa]
MAQEDGSKKDVTAKEEIRAGQHQREIKQDGTTKNDLPQVHQPLSPLPSSIKVRQEGIGTLVRKEISKCPLYHKYTRIHTLDKGRGALGAMNAGVYVVEDMGTEQLYVEKVFRMRPPGSRWTARGEIEMMRRLTHNSLIHYVDAYARDSPFEASVYMEFCDRGSLHDLIWEYSEKRKSLNPDRIPESFIWHAFLGLADALAYLQTGESYISMSPEKINGDDWKPIVHCDIKPANIFLRSRDTPGSTKPFYTLLSDFGLMEFEQKDQQAPCASYGTVEFHAPELAFHPFPQDDQMRLMASPHTGKSDVWALACTMFCMCERNEVAHIDPDFRPFRSKRALGRVARLPSLDITDTDIYSDYLARTIAWAANKDPSKRPDARELVVRVKAEYDLWLQDPKWKAQVQVNGALPPGVTPNPTSGVRYPSLSSVLGVIY